MNIRRDMVSGLFWLAIAIFVCIQSIEVGIGTFQFPGSGFMLFLSAIALGALALYLILTAILSKKTEGALRDLCKGMQWSKVFFILTTLSTYTVVLDRLGYLIATFGMMVVLFGAISRPRWWVRVASALITSSVSYIIFDVWLNISLPKGIWSF